MDQRSTRRDRAEAPRDGAARRGASPIDGVGMRGMGYAVVDYLVDHLETLSEKPVADWRPTAQMLDAIDQPLPAESSPLSESLAFLDRHVVAHMTAVAHPRFHAYIPAPGSYPAALGVFLAAGLNPFVGSSLGGASFSALELLTLRWIAEAVAYPSRAEGIFTSGGSMANLGALAAASADLGDDRRGLVYVSSQGHASMEKAARVLGYSGDQIRRLPTDASHRLDVGAVAEMLERDQSASTRGAARPLFLCANAGTTNSGAVDPLDRLADLCAEFEVWFHVDGAYGGFASLSPRARPLFAGMERADSLTLDPHKWLYVPMGHGCLLVQRAGALAKAFAASGDYLRDVDRAEVNFFDRGPELSRPARALPVWLLLKTVGIDAIRAAIDHDLELAERAEEVIRRSDELQFVSRDLSVVVFRVSARGLLEHQRSELELSLVQELLRGGDALVSGTTLGGSSALRLVVMNHRTTAADIQRSVDAVCRTVGSLRDRYA